MTGEGLKELGKIAVKQVEENTKGVMLVGPRRGLLEILNQHAQLCCQYCRNIFSLLTQKQGIQY